MTKEEKHFVETTKEYSKEVGPMLVEMEADIVAAIKDKPQFQEELKEALTAIQELKKLNKDLLEGADSLLEVVGGE